MAGIGESLLRLSGKKDPRQDLLQLVLGGNTQATPAPAGDTPQAMGAVPGATAPAGPVTAPREDPLPTSMKSPPDLASMYVELMDRERQTSMFDRGLTMVAAGLSQPENRAGIYAGMGIDGSDGSQDMFGGDLLSGITKLQAHQQKLAADAALKQRVPAIAAEYGIDPATAEYLHATGQLDAFVTEAAKPDRQIVQNADGTSSIIDKKNSSVVSTFGEPKKEKVEIRTLADGRQQAYDTVTGQPVGEPTGPAEPAKAPEANIGPNGRDYGAPPKDMRWKRNPDGTVMIDPDTNDAIPELAKGSATDLENTEVQKAAEAREASKSRQLGVMLNKIDEAEAIIDNAGMIPATGIAAQLMKNIGGTDALNLDKALNTLKANLGFNELSAMREASKTGGALGQVSTFELEMLQSTLTSLDQAQDDATLKKNLNDLRILLNTNDLAGRLPSAQEALQSGGGAAEPEYKIRRKE